MVQPFHDASRDAEDGELLDEILHLNLASVVQLTVEHQRTTDEAYLLDLAGFERLVVFRPRYRGVLL